MALEVNEIGIRMHVRDGNADGDRGSAGLDDDGIGEVSWTTNRDEIVAECVRRVLRTLKTLQER